MGAVRGGQSGQRTIRLLDYDPELGASLRPERLAEARAKAEATAIDVPRGVRTVEELTGGRDVAYGVLLLDGLANRTVALDGVVSAQLLGPGELVRVGREASEALVPADIRWTVLEPLTLALLDDSFLLTVRRWPEIVAALFERLAALEERRDIHRALSQLPRVEDRIHALLWLLAERWGRVSSQGVLLRLRLTHELIGKLVGAKRPTVSLALKALEERGTIQRRSDGSWLLEQAWTRAPTDDVGVAADGAEILRAWPPPSRPGAPDAASASALHEVRERVERMRRIHARARADAGGALTRTAAVRKLSSGLRRP